MGSLTEWNLTLEEIENATGSINELKNNNASKVFDLFEKQEPEEQIVKYLEIYLADLFHKKVKGNRMVCCLYNYCVDVS